MSGKQASSHNLTLVLILVALLSAMCTIFFASLGAGVLLSGFLFGAAMSITLLKFTIVTERQAWQLLAVAIAANILAFLVAFYIQLHLPLSDNQAWSMGHGEAISLASLVGGGLVGGYLFLGEALYLLRPGVRASSLALGALLLSMVSGALAAIGWVLGPYLGTAISELFYVAHIPTTVPVPTPYDPLYGYRTPTVEFSLHLIWQTGIAFTLGAMVKRYSATPHAKEISQQ